MRDMGDTGNQYFVNGELLNDERVASLVTTITSTSPIPSIPSLRHILRSQTSLSKVAALAKCKKLIVFDGIPPIHESRRDAYTSYKSKLLQLAHDDRYPRHTALIFCKEWVHLAGALRLAVEHVTTPFLFIHQHDDVLLKPFDLNGCVASMLKNPNLKHIHLTRYTNKGRHAGGMQDSWDGPVDTVVNGGSQVQLTRCFGWSDYSHLTTTEYLKHFVLPKCGHGFPETSLHKLFKDMLNGKTDSEIDAIHLEFGTYLYGGLEDGNYIHHSDGSRDFGAAPHAPLRAPVFDRIRRVRTEVSSLSHSESHERV